MAAFLLRTIRQLQEAKRRKKLSDMLEKQIMEEVKVPFVAPHPYKTLPVQGGSAVAQRWAGGGGGGLPPWQTVECICLCCALYIAPTNQRTPPPFP